MTAVPKTPTLGLYLPPFDRRLWHQLANDNFAVLDSFFGFLGITGFRGGWLNDTAYFAGEWVVDTQYFTVWTCNTNHTSVSAPTTFFTDRANHPTRWTLRTTLPSDVSRIEDELDAIEAQYNQIIALIGNYTAGAHTIITDFTLIEGIQTYTLDVAPATATNCLVIVDSVIQYAELDFDVVGTDLTFINPITSSDPSGLQPGAFVRVITLTTTIDPTGIADGSVTEPKLADDAVSTRTIQDNSITGAHIQSGQITASKLAPNSVNGTSHVVAGSIDSTRIANGSIIPSKIPDGSIELLKLADPTIDGSRVNVNTLALNKLVKGTAGQIIRVASNGDPAFANPVDLTNLYTASEFDIVQTCEINDNTRLTCAISPAYKLRNGYWVSQHPFGNGRSTLGTSSFFAVMPWSDHATISKVYCIGKLFLALHNDGRVEALGEQGYYQAGIGVATFISIGTFIAQSYFNDEAIVAIYGSRLSGGDTNPDATTIYFLTETGKLYATGYNGYGQCGNGSTVTPINPVRCGTLIGITNVIIGPAYRTTVFATDGLQTFGWGNGAYKALGLPVGTYNTPTSITLADGQTTFVQGSTCANHTMLVFANGTIQVAGRGAEYALGTGSSADVVAFTTLAGITDAESVEVHSYANGYSHSLYKNTADVLHTVGYGGSYMQNNQATTDRQNWAVLDSDVGAYCGTGYGSYRGNVWVSGGMVKSVGYGGLWWGYNGVASPPNHDIVESHGINDLINDFMVCGAPNQLGLVGVRTSNISGAISVVACGDNANYITHPNTGYSPIGIQLIKPGFGGL